MEINNDRDMVPGWRWMLLVTISGLIVMGLILVLSPHLGEQLFYFVYYGSITPSEPFSEEARRYIRFTNGVLGAVMIGWMVLLLKLAAMRPNVAGLSNWAAIRLSMAVWFVIDTGFSLVHGIYGNVLLNTVAAIGFFLPLMFGLRGEESRT